ncbi:MAG: TldD/PmbA family protein [Candidatus Bathyarchaeota archaeon]|nr:MAG: TldD/PmbA family protein [Candidatus Bathyarchaeota archaeon]
MSLQIKELADKAVKHASKIGVDFAEIKSEESVTRNIEAVNEEIRTVSESNNIGIGIRVFNGKGVGFSFSNILDKEHIFQAVERALKIAKTSKRRTLMNLKLAAVDPRTETKITNVKNHPRNASLDEKKDLCLRECKTALRESKRIANTLSRFGEYHGTIYYSNSEGTEVSHQPLLTGLTISCVAKKGASIVDARDSYGGSYGLDLFKKEHSPEKMGENAAKWALEKLEAKPAPAGKFEALIDPRLAGVLAHESFGHLSEGDTVAIGASPLAGRIGQKLGTEIVTIVDEGRPREGGYSMPFDDEGVPCKRVEILKDGVLKCYLQNRVTAQRLKMEPTGNARSQDYSFEPIVRMRNTFFNVGDWSPEEALRELKRGIYALDSAGGQVDLTGTFLFKAIRGYWVEGGELKYPLLDVALTGNILELLKNINAVCNNLELFSSPFGGCGKMEQRAFVGLGGPHIRVKDVLFGGTS